MKRETILLDDMPERAHSRIHLASFTFTALVIGVILFFVFQLVFGALLLEPEEAPGQAAAVTLSQDIGHDYCGTFYIWLTVGNNYRSVEAYQAASEATTFTMQTGYGIADNCIVTVSPIVAFLSLFLAFRQADRRRFFAKNGWRFLMAAGFAFLLYNLWVMLRHLYVIRAERDYVTGIFANETYYCQIYHCLGIPALLLLTALIMRQHTRTIQQKPLANNAAALKYLAWGIGIVGAGFMLLRLGTRLYEIAAFRTHDARLPFYHEMLAFPRELADSPAAYRNVLLFRLLKDLPVFAAAAVTLIMLIRTAFAAAEGRIHTTDNKKRLRIAIIALLVSSLLFNVLGIFEVRLLHAHFSGIYGDVVYTIGIRALCDPAIFAVLLWFVSIFISLAGHEQPAGRADG